MAGTPAGWGRFDNNIKLLLHQHLLNEQQYLCIYCQQSIPPKLVKDTPAAKHPSHLEHIRPKDTGMFPHLMFEYTNLSVSCNGFDIEQPPTSPEFCGHKKENIYDDTLFLHPFEITDIEDYFEYDINGKILPSTTYRDPLKKAEYTIATLNLNELALETARQEQYNLLIEEVKNGLDIENYLDASQPQLPKFYSMLRELFGL